MRFTTTLFMAAILGLVTLASAKPIMVSFGTNQGPIIPRQINTSTLPPRNIVARTPAPVSEEREDVPNPSTYRPLVPHQYRTKLYSYRAPANLILGTPLDQKYNPSIEKYNIYRKQQARSIGVDYTGPHIFEKQDYEIYETRKHKTTLQPSTQYDRPNYYQQQDQYNSNKYVPQIGIIYSGGVRYYIPQIVYYQQEDINNKNLNQRQQQQQQQAEDENSVYDKHDEKYYHYNSNNQ